MRQLGDAFRRFELEQAKNADQLKASKPLEKNGNLTENDLMTLNDREWLNDSVINEYFKLILKSSVTGIFRWYAVTWDRQVPGSEKMKMRSPGTFGPRFEKSQVTAISKKLNLGSFFK